MRLRHAVYLLSASILASALRAKPLIPCGLSTGARRAAHSRLSLTDGSIDDGVTFDELVDRQLSHIKRNTAGPPRKAAAEEPLGVPEDAAGQPCILTRDTPGLDYRYQGADWICGSCASRVRQSPISFPPTAPASPFSFKYGFRGPGPVVLRNTGFSIEVRRKETRTDAIPISFEDLPGGAPVAKGAKRATDDTEVPPPAPSSRLTPCAQVAADLQLMGGKFALDNIHFHGPAEHLFEGERHALEMHVVSQLVRPDPTAVIQPHYCVLAFTFIVGESNSFLEEIIKRGVPGVGGSLTFVPSADGFDIDRLVREKGRDGFYYYPGSLTVPPCLEAVEWLVARKPIEASASQLAVFLSEFTTNGRGNYRVVQNTKNSMLSQLCVMEGKPTKRRGVLQRLGIRRP